MLRRFTLALAAASVLGCTDGAAPTDVGAVFGKEGGGRGGMLAQVNAFRAFPESSYIAVRGAVVEVQFIDTIPTDTTGQPPESLMVAGMPLDLMGRAPIGLDSFPTDTLPPDTIPTDTIPPDTIPTDSNPPPPPPPGCGRTGVVVARGRTDGNGALRVGRLRPGIYDLKVIPPERAGLSTGYACGSIVRNDRITPLQVTLFPLPTDSLTTH